MWQLDYPWLLLLLPLPWFGYRYLPDYREARSAVRVPFFGAMSRAVGQTPRDSAGRHNSRQSQHEYREQFHAGRSSSIRLNSAGR